MVRVEVIKDFTLKEFHKLENIKRKQYKAEGKLYVGDTFECDEKMVKYLMGNNEPGETVIKVLEVEPKEKKSSKKLDNCKKNKNML